MGIKFPQPRWNRSQASGRLPSANELLLGEEAGVTEAKKRGRPLLLSPARLLASISSATGIKQGLGKVSERKERER